MGNLAYRRFLGHWDTQGTSDTQVFPLLCCWFKKESKACSHKDGPTMAIYQEVTQLRIETMQVPCS